MEGSTDSLCRLCLQTLITNKSFDIFPQRAEGGHENVIPMRLAAVAAIEVIKFDALPKKICQTCRYQLELSYTFRKKSQSSDAKLRKHFKMLSLGKPSTILSNEDEDQEDLEMFGDSLQFLEEFERIRCEDLKTKVHAELEEEIQEHLEQLKTEIRKELSSVLRREIDKEIREEVRNQERLEIETRLRSECLTKARQELQKETLEKCRREEAKALLNDLEEFLRTKQSERNKVDNIVLLGENNETPSKTQTDNVETNDGSHIEEESILENQAQFPKKEQIINNQKQHMKSLCSQVMSYQIRMNNDVDAMDESDDTVVEQTEEVAVLNCDEIDDENSKDSEDVLEILNVLDYESGGDDVDSIKQSSEDAQKRDSPPANAQSYNKSATVTYFCVDALKKPGIGRSSTTPKIFKCTLCPVEFSTECSLQRHLRVHINGEKSVACPECKIVVSCSSALKRHMIIHSGERPYVCGECNKAFGQKEILSRHENTQHRGLRRHQCAHCDKKFSQKICLTQHIEQQHLGEPRKRYDCHLCTKSFFFSSGLSRHLSFHSGITYKCVACVRTFTDRSSIKRHVLKVHGVEKAQQMMKEIDNKSGQT